MKWWQVVAGVSAVALAGCGKPADADPDDEFEYRQPANAQRPVNGGRGGQPVARTGGQPAARPIGGIDRRLVGVWVKETRSTVRTTDDVLIFVSYHTVSITADGRYTERAESGGSFGSGTTGDDTTRSGRIESDGRLIAFHPDGGQPGVAEYELVGNDGLRLNGEAEMHIRRR